MKTQYSKYVITLFILLGIGLSFSGWLDEKGSGYTEQGLKRVLLTYSVAQGTEFAFEPLGVGLTLAPGEILDPVNDLVERFSWVVLVSGASLGIQQVMIQITSWFWFSLLLTVLLVVSVFFIWQEKIVSCELKAYCYKLSMVLLILRFAIPTIAIVNEGLFNTFLAPQYEKAKLNLQNTTQSLEEINTKQQTQMKDLSFIEKIQQQYESAVNTLDVEEQLEKLKTSVANVSESALNMIIVFVLQTLIFPLLFLWLVLKLVKGVFSFRGWFV